MKKIFLFTIAVTIIAFSSFAQTKGTFKDSRDGKTYKTIKIGTQTWMAENLAYKTYDGSWAYNNSESNVSKYGRLYNWQIAKNVCPTGWHLPSDTEWTSLTNYLGGEAVAGEKLKSSTGWKLDEGKNYGNNMSGFNALPAGFRSGNGGSFVDKGKYSYFWSSTSEGSEYAWFRSLDYSGGEVDRDDDNRTDGYSVRCLRN